MQFGRQNIFSVFILLLRLIIKIGKKLTLFQEYSTIYVGPIKLKTTVYFKRIDCSFYNETNFKLFCYVPAIVFALKLMVSEAHTTELKKARAQVSGCVCASLACSIVKVNILKKTIYEENLL